MRRRKENSMLLPTPFGRLHLGVLDFGLRQQRRRRFSRPLALALALTLLLPAVTLLLPAAASAQENNGSATAGDLAAIRIPTVPAASGPIHTILMFPFADKIAADAPASGFDPDTVGARVENAIKMRLNEIGRYKADSFAPTLPQIQRAVQDSGVSDFSEADAAPPYDSAAKGRKLADEIATDGYLLGAIQSINTDDKTRTVSLTITATLYNTGTGRPVKALAYTGRGVSFSTADDPNLLLQSAINDVAGHVVSSLNADVAQAPIRRDVRAPRHHSAIGAIALGLLVAAAIAIGVTASHHTSHNSGGGTTTTTTTGTGTGTGTTVTSSGPPTPPSGL